MDDEPTDAELTRLADRSLSDARAEALRERVGESSELTARLRAQERAIALTRATARIAAPASVHAAVRERTDDRARRAPRISARPGWRPRVFVPSAVAALAAIVLIVVLVPGSSTTLTVARTAGLALAAPTRNAPPVDPTNSELLSLRVDSVQFPAYEGQADWRATGARTDEIDARNVQTVVYGIAGHSIGYSIVAGAALRIPDGQRRTIAGVLYVTARVGSADLVTWQLDGHTCVLAGRAVSRRLLLRLAAPPRSPHTLVR